MRFRLTPRSMTLDDLKVLYFLGISRDFADMGGNNDYHSFVLHVSMNLKK